MPNEEEEIKDETEELEAPEETNEQPAVEEPAFDDSPSNAKAQAIVNSAKLIKFFVKNPWAIPAVIILFVFLFLCIFIAADTDTTKASTGSSECSSIDFNSTPLSKDEFISLTNEYLEGKTSTTATLFRDNAGLIYDLGREVSTNPEMIYIIAEKEQGWKDTDFTTRCFNFYGMGVYNGTNSGKCFDNLEEGIKFMLDYVKKKGTLDAFTKVYSYLGTYLANPGSSGDGGCYYLTLDDIYGKNYSRCSSSYQCPSSNGGPGCVLTTEAEKQAYIDWQASKILKIRQNIFHLSADACNVSGGVDGSSEGTTFLNETIESFLLKNNTNLEEFNNKILEQGCKYQGTGEGVAYVAATAVSELAKYGKKFHYDYGGMHLNSLSTYGVLSSWGPEDTGPDCSGFVSWALFNAGFNWRSLGATDWGKQGIVVDLNNKNIQVGDLIVTPGNRGWNHVEIITAVHSDEGYFNTVEAASTASGVIFDTVKIGSSKKAVLMTEYYKNAPKSEAFQNMCAERN